MSMMLFKRKTYSVTPDRDEWVAPEETLIDSSSGLTDIEVPVRESIWRFGSVLILVFSVMLIIGAANLAIRRHASLAALVLRNRTVNVSVPPPRGIILDRTGVPLVENVPSFDLLVVTRQLQRNTDGSLAGIERLAAAFGRDPSMLAGELTTTAKQNAVFLAATDITRAQVLSLKDILPEGFSIITSTKRHYLYGPQFAHVLGYVGKVSTNDMTADSYYMPSDTIGRLGVEASYEDVLRGTHGALEFQRSGQTKEEAPQAGGNLVLNVDLDVQRQLYAALQGVLRGAGLTQAAAVAQDPISGAVLGLVSFPSYDDNMFSTQLSQADADHLFNNTAHPLLDRVIGGRYNPGSTIKPFIGMSALQEGIVTPQQVVNTDCIGISIPNPRDPEHPYTYDNWRRDLGPFNLDRAIANSCNVYFFTVGGGFENFAGLGVNRIDRYLTAGLADHLLGIDLPGETTGFVPTPEWKYATTGEPWYQGDTYNISIGQGDLLVTPLWANTILSAIANGGTLWKPQVASRVVDAQKNTLQVFSAQMLGALPFSSAVIADMQRAMRETVRSGTGRIFQDLPVAVAAKTGTAEVIKGRRINSLLTVYAPADNPKVALTVLIEGSASNQGYALDAAHRFLSWYFGSGHTLTSPIPTPTPSSTPPLSPSP